MYRVEMHRHRREYRWTVTSPSGETVTGRRYGLLVDAVRWALKSVPKGAEYQVTNNGHVNEPTTKQY